MGKADGIMQGILGPPKQTGEFWIDLFYTLRLCIQFIWQNCQLIEKKKVLKTACDQNQVNKFCSVYEEVLRSQNKAGKILCHKA